MCYIAQGDYHLDKLLPEFLPFHNLNLKKNLTFTVTDATSTTKVQISITVYSRI
jgi:hypothetical protein